MSDNNDKKNSKKNGKKDGDPNKRVSLWSVLVKYWALFVWTLVALLAIWTALFMASYDFSRYTDGEALARDTPFSAGARFGAALAFLKDYAIFTIPVMTLAGIALALILDAKEHTTVFISKFLQMKADEEMREIAKDEGRAEGRTEGIAQGIAVGELRGREVGIAEGETRGRDAANDAWNGWLRRMREAERDGKPFDEPPPSSR